MDEGKISVGHMVERGDAQIPHGATPLTQRMRYTPLSWVPWHTAEDVSFSLPHVINRLRRRIKENDFRMASR